MRPPCHQCIGNLAWLLAMQVIGGEGSAKRTACVSSGGLDPHIVESAVALDLAICDAVTHESVI